MKPTITKQDKLFLAGLDKAIEFHVRNENDPYGISEAVIVAVLEVRDAFSMSRGLGKKVATKKP